MNKKLRTFVYPVCAFIVLLLLWQVCVMLSTSEIAFPTPVAVFKEFFYILTHKVGNYYTVVRPRMMPNTAAMEKPTRTRLRLHRTWPTTV